MTPASVAAVQRNMAPACSRQVRRADSHAGESTADAGGFNTALGEAFDASAASMQHDGADAVTAPAADSLVDNGPNDQADEQEDSVGTAIAGLTDPLQQIVDTMLALLPPAPAQATTIATTAVAGATAGNHPAHADLPALTQAWASSDRLPAPAQPSGQPTSGLSDAETGTDRMNIASRDAVALRAATTVVHAALPGAPLALSGAPLAISGNPDPATTAANLLLPAVQPTPVMSAPAPLPVAAAFGSRHWPDSLGQQVLWSAQQGLQSASLTLNPPALGLVHIVLQLSEHGAQAQFSSAQPEVRQAIEQALPQLKALFTEAGLQLQHASVDSGQHAPDHQQSAPTLKALTTTRPAFIDDDAATDAPRRRPDTARRLLDTYA